MTQINWGLLQPVDIGAKFQEGWEQGEARRVKRETGAAVQAVLTDPANAGAAINALAKYDPNAAMQLAAFQQKQIAQQRDNQFREATGRYFQSGALNALMPQGTGQGVLGASLPMGALSLPGVEGGVPPISAAPPPPADWQETLGPQAVAALASPPPNGVPTDRSRMMPNAAPEKSGMTAIDPNTALGIDPQAQQGFGAESGATGQYAPGETPMPDAIARAAQSSNMEARNRAFAEMVKIDPIAAMKIESEHRDAMLDRLEDADKAYRLAIARLPRVTDDAGYQQVLGEVDAFLAPLGMNIRETVPANYPGPEGTRQLLMQAMDAQQQLAAMDRRFTAEANAADDAADNLRADRNTDSIIADRRERTDIQRQRAGTADRREARIAGGGGRGGNSGGSKGAKVRPGEAVAKGPNGQRMVVRGGKWVPAQ